MHNLETLFKKAEALRGAVLKARTIESIDDQLKDFLQDHQIIGMARTHEQIWYRARNCQSRDRFDSIHELIYPPNGATDFGRAQYPRSRVLYASWNLPTALEEIGISTGDAVQVIILRLRKGVVLPCHVVGELQFFHYSGRTQFRAGPAEQVIRDMQFHEGFLEKIFIDSVMSEFFRAYVKRFYEYKVTAAFSECLLRAEGGLIYPSVESIGAMNLAVSSNVFDKNFEVLGTAVFSVSKYVGYGLYELQKKHESSDFHENGDIDWKNGKPVTAESLGPFGNIQMNPDYVGWRKT